LDSVAAARGGTAQPGGGSGLKACCWFLVMLFWAIWFSLKPANAAITPQCHGVDWSTNFASRIVSDGEVNQSYGVRHVRHWMACPVFAFDFCAGRHATHEFVGNSWFPNGTPLPRWTAHRPCTDEVACSIEHYPPAGKGDLFILRIGKNASRENPISSAGFSGDGCWASQIQMSPIALDPSAPFVSNSVNMSGLIDGKDGGVDRFSSFVGVIPCEIPSSSPDLEATTAGEYHATVKCGDFAVRVVWWATVREGHATVACYHKYVLRVRENDDGAGADLGICRIRQGNGKSNEEGAFHVHLNSSENSFTVMDPRSRKAVCEGCTLAISRDGEHWYEIIGLQEAPESPKRDPSALLPSRE
jgi:hypothetical protein